MIDNERAGTEPAPADDRAPTSLVDSGDLDADDTDVGSDATDTWQQHADVGDGDTGSYVPDPQTLSGYSVDVDVDGFGGWTKADAPNLTGFLADMREAGASQDTITTALGFYAKHVAE